MDVKRYNGIEEDPEGAYVFHDDFIRLEEELRVTEALLKERERLLAAIPECPDHGLCIPHALEWIEKMKTSRPSDLDGEVERLVDDIVLLMDGF